MPLFIHQFLSTNFLLIQINLPKDPRMKGALCMVVGAKILITSTFIYSRNKEQTRLKLYGDGATATKQR